MTVLLSELVEVVPRFHRSVNVELDFWRADSLDGYVVSPLARDVTMRIAQALDDPKGARAWTLVGPYGSGKSSLVAFLTALICEGPAHVSGHVRFQHSWPDDGPILTGALLGDQGLCPLAPVLIVGERVSLGRAILAGLRTAAAQFWSGRGGTSDIAGRITEYCRQASAGEQVDHDVIIDIVLELAEKVRTSSRPGNGLFIVIDEMGKLLEWAALHPHDADLYLLQRLAETAARSKAPIGLLTVLHQDISTYAAGLTRSLRNEWTKIGGRFETIGYLEPVHHVVRLLDGAISGSPEASSTLAAAECRQAADILAGGDLFRSTLPLAGTFPLHPLTALCVGPLFRTAIGQNERSVFAFLNSHEPLGFQDWLRTADGSAPYRLADLFDYAVHNTRALVEGTRAWSSAEFALSRLNGAAEALDLELVKAIALLGMVRIAANVRADEQILALATGRPRREVKKGLDRLKKRSVALYVRHRSAWELWDGSDVDIEDVVDRHRADILARGGIAEQIETAVSPTPITASRHYIQTGTFRVLRVRYVSTMDAVRLATPKNGDGVLVIVVPDQLDALADLDEALDALPVEAADMPPRAITLPVNVEQFHEQGLDYLAVTQALKLTPELENDPIARRVLQERQLAARDALQAAHEIACAGTSQQSARWRYCGRWLAVDARASSLASAIFDRAFDHAPQIHNELINRAHVSSAAAGARRVLMQRMLTCTAERRLAIGGHPPELSMYRSILERMGVHRETDKGWTLAEPVLSNGESSPLSETWKRIGEFLQDEGNKAGGRWTFADLTEALARPPYGVRAGVAPILVWAWYIAHQDDVFIYEDKTFIPEPDESLVERLLRQPQDVELQAAVLSGKLAEVALAIRERAFGHLDLSRGRVPLRVVRQLVLFVKKLSPFARRTERVSVEARLFRTALSSAKDTVKLLVDALPEALGIDLARPGGADHLALEVARRMRELRQADDHLLKEIDGTLRTLFDFEADDPSFYRKIARRAQALESKAGTAPQTQRFIEQTAALDPDVAESRSIWLKGVATICGNKRPETWFDSDLHTFQQKAEERVRAFGAAERLAFKTNVPVARIGQPIIRLDYVDDRGREKSHFGLLDDTDGMRSLMKEAQAQVERLRNVARTAHISDRGVAYALLEAMMQTLDRTTVQEEDR